MYLLYLCIHFSDISFWIVFPVVILKEIPLLWLNLNVYSTCNLSLMSAE